MRRMFVIGASAGGVEALSELVRGLPAEFPAALLVVLHVGSHASTLPKILSARGNLPANHAQDGEEIVAGRIYVAPPDRHLMLQGDRVLLTRGPKENHARPAIDPLFRSAALQHGARVVGVLLTGKLDDGTAGLLAVKACGGVAVVQDPAEAMEPSMPATAMLHVSIDHCVRLRALAPLLIGLAAKDVEAAVNEPSESLRHEHALSQGEGDALDHLRHFASPSTFTCPDCHGALWRVTSEPAARYRCHTGHAFTQHTLLSLLQESREAALWNALRVIQEQEMLLSGATQTAPAGDDATSQAVTRLAEQAALLRRLLGVEPKDSGDRT